MGVCRDLDDAVHRPAVGFDPGGRRRDTSGDGGSPGAGDGCGDRQAGLRWADRDRGCVEPGTRNATAPVCGSAPTNVASSERDCVDPWNCATHAVESGPITPGSAATTTASCSCRAMPAYSLAPAAVSTCTTTAMWSAGVGAVVVVESFTSSAPIGASSPAEVTAAMVTSEPNAAATAAVPGAVVDRRRGGRAAGCGRPPVRTSDGCRHSRSASGGGGRNSGPPVSGWSCMPHPKLRGAAGHASAGRARLWQFGSAIRADSRTMAACRAHPTARRGSISRRTHCLSLR